MSSGLNGALLGLAFASGLILLVVGSPPARPAHLDQRLVPYLRDAPRPSKLLDEGGGGRSTAVRAVSRLLRPFLADAIRMLDRMVGGRASVSRRLGALGSRQTVDDFRLEQVVWGGVGFGVAAVGAGAVAVTAGRVDVLSTVLLCVGGVLGGVIGRDWLLSRRVARRKRTMLAEFPVVAELLALAVTAGEGPVGAIERVCRLTGGEVAGDLSEALGRARAGASLEQALESLRDRTTLDPLARFVDGLIVAIERGTPLAEVLRAQAADVREAGKRTLLEAGGRKEIAMMIPVVFLILPVTVLFALYPGLVSITQLAR